jgi:FPC/CPF motif-containing protein YcgG
MNPSVVPTTTATYLERAWTENPFDSDRAKSNSSYSAFDGTDLVRLLETAPAGTFDRIAHSAFRDFVNAPEFSCLGARAAINSGTYRFGTYRMLNDANSTAGLARDLYAFAQERQGFESLFTTYVAVFSSYAIEGDAETSFEGALWNQLGQLYELDREHHAWDPVVSSDPEDPAFSYSFAGTGFFVVGLHSSSSRSARRFAWPTLVFNAHAQFESLRRNGQFPRLQARIRARELELDGSLNPNLADYGHHSEARQYAGRALPADWKCPFRPN